MQNSDPVYAYLDALDAYDAETVKARQLIKDIAAVASAMQYHVPDFLRLTYSLALPMPAGGGHRVNRGAHFNMNEWPDGPTIEVAMKAWHASFARAREAWEQVPNNRRNTVRQPPEALSTS